MHAFLQSDEVVMQITLLCQHKKIFHSQYYLLFELNCFGHKSIVVPFLATKLKLHLYFKLNIIHQQRLAVFPTLWPDRKLCAAHCTFDKKQKLAVGSGSQL